MRLLLPILVLSLLAAVGEARPNPGPFQRIAVIRLREQPGEQIDESVKVSVLRRIEAARAWGADCVVFDIESYGGLVTASIETGDEIYALGREVHTIAYVGRKAISGAAMLSLACQEIVMAEVAKIGDCQAIMAGADGQMVQAPEKIQSTVAAVFRTYAEGNGYPVPVVEAMVRQEMEVVRYKRRGTDPPQWSYYRSDTPDGLPTRRAIEMEGLEEPPEVVVRENELAIFTARQAMDYGICSREAPTLDALVKSLRAEESAVVDLEWNWTERVSRFLLDYKWLLFLLGAGSLYFALKMPGTGVPEALTVICFGLFFGASAIAYFAGPFEVVLFFIGVVLLVVEIFVLPGFGVAGFAGLACILVAIAMAAIPEGPGELPKPTSEYLLEIAKQFLLGTLGAILVVMLVARYLPHLPFFHRLALHPAPSQTGSAVGQRVPALDHPLLGAEGVAESNLRPAGRARIEGRRMDVVAEGRFVAPGTRVRVVAVQGNRITVRPIDA